MSEQRALTWSGKWHIVNPDHPDANRYAIARCGAYVYRDDDRQYPEHLTRIKAGTKKSTGDCKLCNRSAGIKTATVELPEPDENGRWEPYTGAVAKVWADDNPFGDGGRVCTGAPGDTFTWRRPEHARLFAAALLAAANAAEAM